MEEKVWSIEELPIGAEILVSNQDDYYEVIVLQSVKDWVWCFITDNWDLVLVKGKFVQDDQNRFTLLDEEDS